MKTTNRCILITGGAGFIGSHLVDAFMNRNVNVHVLDNLSNGSRKNIKRWLNNPKFTFIHGDLLNTADIEKVLNQCENVHHLAANPEVRLSSVKPEIHYRQNIKATYNLLEAIRKNGGVKTLTFMSSSTVYGEATKIPTPEDYAPLEPISIYGASKLACEALIIAYANTYGFKTIIFRLANIIGPRSKHGVIYDFIQKLNKNPRELEILGDGTQTKSYLHVKDCIKAILACLEKAKGRVQTFNVGSEDQTNVKTTAKIVTEEMELKNVKFKFTGGVDGGRGWKGDVKNMLLDVKKLKTLGWKPTYSSEEAVKLSTSSTEREVK